MAPQKEHMLLVCGRWAGPGTAVHGDFVLGRLLRVDGLHRLFLKHRPVTCGFVCQRETRQDNSKIKVLGGLKLNIESEELLELPRLLFHTVYINEHLLYNNHWRRTHSGARSHAQLHLSPVDRLYQANTNPAW